MEGDRSVRLRAEIINAPDIPTIPGVLVRLLEISASERSSARALIEVISSDQALTSRILRTANSSFYGVPGSVATLQRAVMVLGGQTIQGLALGVKIWDSFRAKGGERLEKLWEHASLTAVAARAVAVQLRVPAGEHAFTAGLLHDLGSAALMLHCPEAMADLPPDEVQALDVERTLFGADHACVGGWLTSCWRLPVTIIEVVRDHHQQTESGSLELPELVGRVERLVAGTRPIDSLTDEGAIAIDASAAEAAARLERAGLSTQAWEEIWTSIDGQREALRQLLAGQQGS